MKTLPKTQKKAGLALLCGLLALAAYWGAALYFDEAHTSGAAHFNLLAEAFLQGRLHIEPIDTIDLTLHNGRWYVPFPPLPALLMMPWVALTGVDALNTVIFCALFGAINVALVFLILTALAERKHTQLSTADNLWLTLLFGLGSVHWYMSTLGSVWFVAQICTVTFIALSVWIAVERGPAWLAGLALGLAVAARPTVVFTWFLLLGIAASYIAMKGQPLPWRRLARWALDSTIPILLVVLALLAYNQARFDNPFDFGYANAEVSQRLKPDLDEYGQFSTHYIRRNVKAMLLAMPHWDPSSNFWDVDGEGLSILVTTPALVYLLGAHKRSWLALGGWLSMALLVIPLMLYYNTGWWQFGYRFSMDFMVPAVVLLATAVRPPLSLILRGLILFGAAVNLFGVYWWHR